jgi:choloylglycine hydrolase
MGHFPHVCLVVVGVALVAAPAYPCSRYLSNTSKLGVFAARTMDWPGTTEPTLWVFPRGVKRDGGTLGDEVVVKENAAKWTSKYGSMVTSMGLAQHRLDVLEQFEGFLHVGRVVEQVLEQNHRVHAGLVGVSLTVVGGGEVEHVAGQPLLVHPVGRSEIPGGEKATVHWAIEDASGDSAIIEYVKGKLEIHHSKDHRVMTNEPAYGEQLRLLKAQDFSKPSSDTPLPGNVRSIHRFQRASYFGAVLPEPKNEREAIANVLSVIRNVSVPFGAPYGGFGVYNTEYRTAINVTKGRYFFELTTSPNVMWADLSKFKLEAGSPVTSLNPDDIELSGDVSGKFKNVNKAPF